MTPPDDEPRDARLQAALRHAPDRDAAPPAALSAQILAQAQRAAAAPQPTSSGPGWAERWFGWMSRPVAAGAFGSVLIAGFVGMMWRDGPPPESTAVAEAPAVAPAPAPSVAPAVAPSVAPSVAPAPAPAPAPPTAPAAAPPPPPLVPVPAETPAPSAQARQKSGPTPPAVPAPPAQAEAARDATSESRPATAAAPAAPAAPLAAPPPPAAPAPHAAPPPPAAPAPAAARQALAAIDPLAPVIAALSAPTDSAWRERLQALSDQTRGRWRAVPARAAEAADNRTAGASAGPVGEPVFDSQGRLLGHLQVDTDQAIWRAADGRIWRAPALR